MQMNIVVLIISMLLFFVLFFGIGFILNMLLRMSWIMAIIYPIISIFIIDKVRFVEYFTNAGASFSDLFNRITNLALADILILTSGLFGGHCSRCTIKALEKEAIKCFKKNCSC